MALTQETRSLKLTSPLGENALLLTAFDGQEAISELFRFELELISDNNTVKPTDIVGKNVTFSLLMTDGSPRFFNGFVSRFAAGGEMAGRRTYRAEVVPWLWFLTQTADCRIFQNKNVPQIVEQIFNDLGFTDFEMNLQLTHDARDYCVQYRETDFEFVSRLMEEEGIFYFFKHEEGKHTLVVADHKGAYFDCRENTVDMPPTVGRVAFTDHLTSWVHQFAFSTGKYAQTDFNFETPSTSLMSQTKTVLPISGMDKYEIYDYPGLFPDKSKGTAFAKLRMEQVEASYDQVDASSQCKSFTPGGRFTIGVHTSADEEGKSYVVRSIEHHAREGLAYETGGGSAEFDYANKFTCFPDGTVYRSKSKTRRPVVQGIQTAIVVGPPGEELHTDKYGRVKVQFHWDREGKKDDNSSCWVRVSQTHAGAGFGAIHIPRIGEEVIISFLEGNPDRPIVTGRVYHQENMPPYGLPDAMLISGIKTKSHKGTGYNEYIMDDTKGAELIREHAQFDKRSKIEHDLFENVLNDRWRTVSKLETISIGKDQAISVGQDRKLSVHGKQEITVGTDQSESIGANYELTVNSDQTTSIGSAHKLTVGSNRTTSINADDSLSVAGKLTIGAGGDIEISSDTKITLTVGGSSITIENTKITIAAAATVAIQGDAKIELQSPMIKSQATGVNEITGATVKIN